MKKLVFALMFFASASASIPSFAAEPSLHAVYQAAEAGRLDEAQGMMREVLQAHPNSGKAHFVEAELLAKQGKTQQAANELATAEKFAPGLPFANTQAVSSLKASLGQRTASPAQSAAHFPLAEQAAPQAAPSAPWPLLFLGLGLIAFIVWASKFMRRVSGQAAPTAGPAAYGAYQPAYPGNPQPGAPAGYGMAPAAAPGLGSQMLGGLATGAAVGAGVVAGEALMHHFMDGGRTNAGGSGQNFASFDSIPSLPATPLNDMGGNDFGITDTSWDDGGASSDSDWN